MSGIAAIIRFDGASVEPGAIERMTSAMACRGPDGIAHWRGGAAALGHCAMHTTAESLEAAGTPEGAQPLTGGDGRLVLVMDGWLSNWEELRGELLARGVRLRNRSDAELVLRAYELWGEDCLRRIDGEYAFAVWDSRRRAVFCARDQVGLRPLHYHWNGRRLLVASDPGAIAAAADFALEPNRGMIAEIMANDWIVRDETVWRGVMRLLPAHTLSVDGAGGGGPRTAPHWSAPLDAAIRYRRDEDYFAHYRVLLTDCVRRASRTQRMLGCTVSGGLDSSAVFCLGRDLLGKGGLPAAELKGYTYLGGKGAADDDIAYARAVGRHLGVQIAEIEPWMPDPEWFARRAREDRDIPPFPNAALSVATSDAAARDGCRVVLNGEGGDQWARGGPFVLAELMAGRDWRGIARSLGEDLAAGGFARTARQALRFGLIPALPERVRRLGKSLLGRPSAGPPEMFWLSRELRELLVERRARFDPAPDPAPNQAATSPARRAMLDALHDPFSALAYDQFSRLSARSGIEQRSPMHARQFIEFAFATPERIRYRAMQGKFTHRQSLRQIVPDDVLDRATKAEFSNSVVYQLDNLDEFFTGFMQHSGSGNADPDGVLRLHRMFADPATRSGTVWELWGVYACESLVAADSLRV